MTMPAERTRTLRFGWEFLLELRDAANLTDDQRSTIEEILEHYPMGSEIKQWAMDGAFAKRRLGQLKPEDLDTFGIQNPTIPDTITRGPATPEQRTRALRSAYEFFRIGLMNADNLTAEQRRQKPYVLRHFPESHEINS